MNEPTNQMSAQEIRKQILKAQDLPEETVQAWGLTLTVRGLSGAERDTWQSSLVRVQGEDVIPNPANASAKLVAKCIVDPKSHKRVFSDADINELGKKSGRELNKVYKLAARLSGIGEDTLEALEKNFESGQDGDSLTD